VLAAGTKMTVNVIEQKTGKQVTDLKAEEFVVLEDKTERRVESVEFVKTPVDVMLLLDTSLVGHAVQPVAGSLISQLAEKEQMAIVAFHSSADLIQDFTASQELLQRAVGSVKYGNSPRLLDALYATIDGGFEHATFRRALLLLTTGFEGPSRTGEKEVIRLARRNGVSIFPVFMAGYGKSMFENLARQTGGASFSLRDLERSKDSRSAPAQRIFEVLRGHYTMTVAGNLELGEKLKVEVKRPGRYLVSVLPLE
jgi:VWFA-related protein